MKAHLLTLCILFGFFLSISLAYGDDKESVSSSSL